MQSPGGSKNNNHDESDWKCGPDWTTYRAAFIRRCFVRWMHEINTTNMAHQPRVKRVSRQKYTQAAFDHHNCSINAKRTLWPRVKQRKKKLNLQKLHPTPAAREVLILCECSYNLAFELRQGLQSNQQLHDRGLIFTNTNVWCSCLTSSFRLRAKDAH